MIGNSERTRDTKEAMPTITNQVEIGTRWTKTERTALAHLINRDLEAAVSRRTGLDAASPAYAEAQQTVTALKSLVEQVWNLQSEELEEKRALFSAYLT